MFDFENFNDSERDILQVIANNMKEGIWVIDQNESTQFVNKKLCKLFGYKEKDMIGKHLFSFMEKQEIEKAKHFLHKRKGGIRERHLFTFLDAKNSPLKVLLRAIPVINRKGGYNGAIAFITEQKSVRKQKKRYERIREELDFIIDHIPALVFYKDKSNHYLKVNSYVAKAHQSAKKELEGKLLDEIYPEEQAKAYYKDDLEVIKSGKPKMDYEEKWIKNGEEVWVKTSKIPLKDDEGNIKGLLGVSVDISDQKKAAEIIKKKLEFETIIASISSRFIGNKDLNEAINKSLQDLGIISGADRVFLFQFQNERKEMCNTHEWTDEFIEPTSFNYKELLINDYGWLMSHILQGKIVKINDIRSIPSTYVNSIEFCKTRGTKSLLIFPIIIQSVVGGFIGFETVEKRTNWNDEDLTLLRFSSQIFGNAFERKKSEERLKESEEKFRIITEQSQIGIGIIQDNQIRYVNKEFSNIFDNDEKDILNWSINDFFNRVHHDDKTILRGLMEDIKISQKSNRQFRIILENGDEKWLNTFCNRINIGGKSAELYIMIDISQRKEIEEIREDFNEQLEIQVVKRTKELEEALEKQKLYLDQIIKSSKFKTDFLATMSHELRTPLNAIIGFTDILLEELYGPLVEDQRDYLLDINTAAQHLLEMITRILDISKIESGQLILNLKKFSLNAIVEQVKSTLKPIYKKKDLEFEIQGLDKEKVMRADPIRFKEVLLNLLNNAIKYTIEGKVSIKLKEGREYWIIKVKDTGIGIASKDHDLVFKEFKRVDSPYVRSVQGTGLGLSLTKRIIDLHKGEISFTSVLGSGTVFTVKIPKNIEDIDEFENIM